jgi:hypothetical protein
VDDIGELTIHFFYGRLNNKAGYLSVYPNLSPQLAVWARGCEMCKHAQKSCGISSHATFNVFLYYYPLQEHKRCEIYTNIKTTKKRNQAYRTF